MKNKRKLRETFPHLYAEFPADFYSLFDSDGRQMTHIGRALNQQIKDVRKKRMTKN